MTGWDYLAFDRHPLQYLNLIEKVNCEYCAHANGTVVVPHQALPLREVGA